MRTRNVTQAELSRRIEISAPSLSRILTGKTQKLNPETVEALCRWAGIDEADLLAISRGHYPAPRSRPLKVVEALRDNQLVSFFAELVAEDPERAQKIAEAFGYRPPAPGKPPE